ncbi:hypothetical protein B0T26DRAFT_430369 [Lasiosphaeria miniovina]|uniref:Uncharacterized protein n=1 Tax=Lasiosphaeria miniovina TaxID=1954250 RepID=A0AA40A622_9PEZI|nr:uncharacterized protein B0T26DRAFT_430369 [Lasiosphaeria miniovina]KAK0710003.1 hypothetical protein B0T26DRAFT_430369 [Lasiosphaeria miniovina]
MFFRSSIGDELLRRLKDKPKRPCRAPNPTPNPTPADTDDNPPDKNTPDNNTLEEKLNQSLPNFREDLASPAEIRLYRLGKRIHPSNLWRREDGRGHVDVRCRMWTTNLAFFDTYLESGRENGRLFLAYFGMHLVYGGLHLLAWNGPFRTRSNSHSGELAASRSRARCRCCLSIFLLRLLSSSSSLEIS